MAAHGSCRQDPATDGEDNQILTNSSDMNPALLGRPGFLAPCAGYSNSFYLSPCSVAKASLGPGGIRQPGSFCRATVDDIQGDLPENKPRIWSLADVATSRSATRQPNGAPSPVTGQGGGGGGPVGMCGGAGVGPSPSMGQSFQPWANGGGGAYCDDVATSYPVTPYNTMTSFPVGLTHQGAMVANGASSNHLEGDGGAGGNQMGVLGNHMRSPREQQMALQYQTRGINGYSDGTLTGFQSKSTNQIRCQSVGSAITSICQSV